MTAVEVAPGDGVPFVVLAWAATVISTKKAIPPNAASALCRRTHNIHGAGPRGALYDMPGIMSGWNYQICLIGQ
jgi:hypothetical protein